MRAREGRTRRRCGRERVVREGEGGPGGRVGEGNESRENNAEFFIGPGDGPGEYVQFVVNSGADGEPTDFHR